MMLDPLGQGSRGPMYMNNKILLKSLVFFFPNMRFSHTNMCLVMIYLNDSFQRLDLVVDGCFVTNFAIITIT